jgi:hypothetical protein
LIHRRGGQRRREARAHLIHRRWESKRLPETERKKGEKLPETWKVGELEVTWDREEGRQEIMYTWKMDKKELWYLRQELLYMHMEDDSYQLGRNLMGKQEVNLNRKKEKQEFIGRQEVDWEARRLPFPKKKRGKKSFDIRNQGKQCRYCYLRHGRREGGLELFSKVMESVVVGRQSNVFPAQ